MHLCTECGTCMVGFCTSIFHLTSTPNPLLLLSPTSTLPWDRPNTHYSKTPLVIQSSSNSFSLSRKPGRKAFSQVAITSSFDSAFFSNFGCVISLLRVNRWFIALTHLFRISVISVSCGLSLITLSFRISHMSLADSDISIRKSLESPLPF